MLINFITHSKTSRKLFGKLIDQVISMNNFGELWYDTIWFQYFCRRISAH